MAATSDPEVAARQVGLAYVSDEMPGATRRRRGRGFSYHGTDGSLLDGPERARVASLVIPPAWTDVWICEDPEGHLQVTGRDDRDRKQYLYHPRWREARDAEKFANLVDFGDRLVSLRAAVESDLAGRRWSWDRSVALVVRLLDRTHLRVGGAEYAADNESYGLTTLLREHVTMRRDHIILRFPGKSGVEQIRRVDEPEVVANMRRCASASRPMVFGYRAGGELLRVTADDVNQYLRDKGSPDLTARDFRTWGANVAVVEALGPSAPGDDDDEQDRAVLDAEQQAAENLGNTVAVARSAYIHPELADAYRSGELHAHWVPARSSARTARAENCLGRWLHRSD